MTCLRAQLILFDATYQAPGFDPLKRTQSPQLGMHSQKENSHLS